MFQPAWGYKLNGVNGKSEWSEWGASLFALFNFTIHTIQCKTSYLKKGNLHISNITF